MDDLVKTGLKDKLTTLLSGVAGEYFVAAELSRRGLIASITLRNSQGVDILATNSEASRSVAIQVKTNQGSRPEWLMNSKVENFYSDNHFFVFVNLNGPKGNPEYFVVPSKVVADYASRTHGEWLATRSKKGTARNDSSMRKFVDKEGNYKNRWDLLGLLQ